MRFQHFRLLVLVAVLASAVSLARPAVAPCGDYPYPMADLVRADALFEDGFESGNFAAWSGTTVTSGGSASVLDTNPHEGSYSATFEADGMTSGTRRACAYKNIDEGSVYARAYFYMADGLPLIDTDDRFTLIQFLSSGGGIISNLQIRRVQGEDLFTLFAFDSMQTTTSVYPQPTTWYCLELHTRVHPTGGSVKAYINGAEHLALTDMDTTGQGNVTVARFGLANSINIQHRVSVQVDTAAVSQSYIGESPSPVPPWDVNQDYKVDIYDMVLVASAYASTPESPHWNSRADVNSDGVVNIFDLVIVSRHYGEDYGGEANTLMGVSYSSRTQDYSDTTDSVLDQDFSLFRNSNVSLISLNVIWRAVEPRTRGVYDSSTIGNLKRVLAKAEEYGIGVLFSFHTHFQQQEDPYETPWHLPPYVVDPYTGKKITLAIARSEEMKAAFLDYVQHVVSQVKSSPAIDAWSLLNEPMYWWDSELPAGFSHKQSFQQLMAEGTALLDTLDPRPVTVKFALPDSPWSGDFDLALVLQIFDEIVALTSYIDPATGRDPWGMTTSDLTQAVSDCAAAGRELWIAEFGKTTLNDEAQRAFFEEAVALYSQVGAKTLIAWTWIHDQTGMPDSDRGWSLCYDGGTPRPAFFELQSPEA